MNTTQVLSNTYVFIQGRQAIKYLVSLESRGGVAVDAARQANQTCKEAKPCHTQGLALLLHGLVACWTKSANPVMCLVLASLQLAIASQSLGKQGWTTISKRETIQIGRGR